MLKNKYVSAVIALLFIVVAAYNLKFFYSRNSSSVKPSVQGSVAMKHSPSVTEKQPEHLPEYQDQSTWKRDPFGLQSESGISASGDFHLMGIIKRDGKSHALINGGVYSANQKIGGSFIKEIKRESIVLSTNGNLIEIYLDDHKDVKEKIK